MIINADGFSVTSFTVDPRYFNNGQTVSVTFQAKAVKTAVNGYLTIVMRSKGGEQVVYESAKESWYLNREKTVSFSFLMGDLTLGEEEANYSDVSFHFSLAKDGDPSTVYTCQIDPETGADGKIEWRYIRVTSTHPQAAICVVAISDATKVNGGDASLYDYFGSIIKGHSKMTYTVTSQVPLNTKNPDNRWVEYGLAFNWLNGTRSETVYNDTGVFGDPVGGYASNEFRCSMTMRDLYKTGSTAGGQSTVIDYGAPLITNVVVERYNPDTVDAEGNHTYPADDAGTRVRFGFLSAVQAIAEKNAWTLSLECGPVGTAIPYKETFLSGTDGSVSSLSIDSDEARALYEGSVPETERWYFTFTLSDMISSSSMTVYVEKAGGIFSIEKHGIGIGMRAQGTATDKRVDVAHDWSLMFHSEDGGVQKFPPAVTESDNGKVLMVVEGKWALGNGGSSGGISPVSAIKSIAQQQFQNNTELESVNLPGATTLGTYAFSGCSNLKTVNLPLVTTIPNNCFQDCAALETVDLGSATSLGYSAFSGCTSLKRLIIRSSTRCSATNNTFTGSGFANGICEVYVHSNLVASYQGASVWNTNKNKIFAIEDYPEITGG